MDFIVSLPITINGYDAILTVTDKFSKQITLILGLTTWDAFEWAIVYYNEYFTKFSLPRTIISDRDPKFTSNFQTTLFKRARVRLALTVAYYPAANRQSKRINQTVETALRCLIADRANNKSISKQDELLPNVSYALNTVVNAATRKSPFKLLYGFPPRDGIDPTPLESIEADQFIETRRQIREEAIDNIELAKVRMAQYFNERHSPINVGD